MADVVRICDFERKSRNPYSVSPRDPCEADIIIMPMIRVGFGARYPLATAEDLDYFPFPPMPCDC